MIVRKVGKRRKKLSNRTAKYLDACVEGLNAFVPLIVLVMGIGLLNILPPTVTYRVFNSEQERAQFYSEYHQAAPDAKTALVLSDADCSGCEPLVKYLDEQKIPYIVKVYPEDDLGQMLYARTSNALGKKDIPIVLFGPNVVIDLNPNTIKLASARAAK